VRLAWRVAAQNHVWVQGRLVATSAGTPDPLAAGGTKTVEGANLSAECERVAREAAVGRQASDAVSGLDKPAAVEPPDGLSGALAA